MILVIGRGHLGHIIANSLGANLFDGRLESIPDIQLDYATHIINTAGKTDLKWCEENVAEASYVNSYLPIKIFQKCRSLGTKFVQLSSGCVWNGPYDVSGQPFTPKHITSPQCHYAVTKASCDEELIKEYEKPGKSSLAILRLRMPYSHVKSNRNLFSKLLGYKELIDTHNSVTSSKILCDTIRTLVTKDTSTLWNRITCVYDAGITTPYNIGVKLAHAGLRDVPCRTSKAKLDAWHKPRRVDTVMSDMVFEREIRPRSVGEMLDETLERYVKS